MAGLPRYPAGNPIRVIRQSLRLGELAVGFLGDVFENVHNLVKRGLGAMVADDSPNLGFLSDLHDRDTMG